MEDAIGLTHTPQNCQPKLSQSRPARYSPGAQLVWAREEVLLIHWVNVATPDPPREPGLTDIYDISDEPGLFWPGRPESRSGKRPVIHRLSGVAALEFSRPLGRKRCSFSSISPQIGTCLKATMLSLIPSPASPHSDRGGYVPLWTAFM